MGINIPTREELIANDLDSKSLADKVGMMTINLIFSFFFIVIEVFVGADSLEYLSVEGLIKAVQRNIEKGADRGHCTACLTGEYPEDIPKELDW
jgi:amidophosphoribosyltransferase